MDNFTGEDVSYTIGNARFVVRRSFGQEKTVKDLISEIISRRKSDDTFEDHADI